MRSIIVSKNEAGQRFDKLLSRYLNKAPSGFIYKMLRKKNITLNGKKAAGKELLTAGDEIRLFLSDETYQKFSEKKKTAVLKTSFRLPVVYEDDNLLLINKPAGILSQKAAASDISINEYCIDYLERNKTAGTEESGVFTPAVCNRLDRNTSGLIICAKTLHAAQQFSSALKFRTIHKYYQCLVAADIRESKQISGYLYKDAATNRVSVSEEKPAAVLASKIETAYTPLGQYGSLTLLDVKLITGKTHQIRAHLASNHAPIVGDHKYGSPEINRYYKEHFGVSAQLLHAYKLVMPVFDGTLSNLSNKTFSIELPEIFLKIINR